MAVNLILPLSNSKPKSTPFNNTQNLSNYQSDARISLLRYIQALTQNHFPKKTSFISAIKACSNLLLIYHGKAIHAHILKVGIASDRFVGSSVISFYSAIGHLDHAQKVFDGIPVKDVALQTCILMAYLRNGDIHNARKFFGEIEERDVVTWNAMLTGLVHNGWYEEAVELFRNMLINKVKPTEVTIICVISACSQIGSLSLGQWIHSYVQKHLHEINPTVTLRNSLIHMYAKCGRLDIALDLFCEQEEKNLESYNTMLTNLSLYGGGSMCLSIFSQILKLQICPDRITFLGLLMACSHAGVISYAFTCIKCMGQVYGVEPGPDHYGCLIDVLSKKGFLEEAREVIETMPFEPDAYSWGALLSACINYGDTELGLEVAKKLIELEWYEEGRYTGLINLCMKVGRTEEAVMLRNVIRRLCRKDNSGRSVIEIDGIIHEFAAGDSINDV
ncbi:Pentatricopeptide repeat-containing protein [Rhynchospora pubera]|uniref:Pentatricopeptide repeat-containing protein n=1 Tax=Rhynchospora pubera TaxID=906938 RepID=A0AAV8GM32_9POAL|nr:Pentatricopeptide repeat-containing protein [Rhynchospora pubera]